MKPRPIHKRQVKGMPIKRGGVTGYWNERLNNQERAGGVGFRVPVEDKHDLWHRTVARVARDR